MQCVWPIKSRPRRYGRMNSALKGQYLFNAARAGDRSTIQAVLGAQGAAVDLESAHSWRRQTALHAAASQAHVDCLSDLVKAGANVDAADKDGWTPLHCAACSIGPARVSLLLTDSEGRVTRYKAAEGGHQACVSLLLAAGANVDAAANGGATPLLLAAQKGDEACLTLLLKAGASLAAANRWTALYCAAQQGQAACVSLLLEAGANVDTAVYHGQTPLYIAAFKGYGACVSLLLEAGAKVDAKDSCGNTPLIVAARNADEACVSLLLKAGANVDAADKTGWTPLRSAVSQGKQACVSLLLKAGAKLGVAASDGRNSTPLSLAHQSGYIAVVATLQGEARWRRRRALALIREQREAGSDSGKARKVWKHSKMAKR